MEFQEHQQILNCCLAYERVNYEFGSDLSKTEKCLDFGLKLPFLDKIFMFGVICGTILYEKKLKNRADTKIT